MAIKVSGTEVIDSSRNVVNVGTVDGRDVSADGTKLDGIEAGATADQTGAEIKSLYEAEADTNAYTDAEKSKLAGIEAGADITDTANVTAAGALMDSEVTNLAAVKAFDPTDYATAAQGTLADSAVQPNDSPTFGSITVTGTVDGRDVAADGTKLDGIEAGADVTDAGNVNPLVDTHLNTSSATTGQYLGWNGSDYAWSTVSGYTDADVDTHLNTSSATTGQALTWNGSDYEWATSGAINDIFYENSTNVTADYTITSGKNAVTAGPVTIDSGVTVTVPTGSRWAVV